MNKILLTLLSASCLGVVACSSGSSSTNTNPPTQDNFNLQSTVNLNQPTKLLSSVGGPPTQFTGFGSNGSGAYMGTTIGSGLVTGNSLNTSDSVVMNLISGTNGVVYYTTGSLPQSIYSNVNGQVIDTIPTAQGVVSALSPASSNGSMFYGTSLGYVGLINNPAGKTIAQIPYLGDYPSVLAIGCIANGSCNSGQQGIIAMTGTTESSIFESAIYNADHAQYTAVTNLYYYNLGAWAAVDYTGLFAVSASTYYFDAANTPAGQESAPVSPFTQYTGATPIDLPEFVTSVAFNNGNIYVGTNLFNIYVAANYSCNNGQMKTGGCPVKFTGPINQVNGEVFPLGWMQDGSAGIVSLSVQSNGQLMAIAQESATYSTVYVSNLKSY